MRRCQLLILAFFLALSSIANAHPQLLNDLTALYYSEAIGAVLKKLLETDDFNSASHAAYLIGEHGFAGDEQLLEARLKRFLLSLSSLRFFRSKPIVESFTLARCYCVTGYLKLSEA